MTKRLPDHSTNRRRYDEIISESQLRILREDYQFSDSYDFEMELNNAAFWYSIASSSISNPPIKDIRHNLNSLKSRIKKLQESFKVLGQSEYDFMNRYLGDMDINSFEDQLHNWFNIAYFAHGDSVRYVGKKHAEKGPLRVFIRDLHKIYQEGTGQKDKCSKGTKENGYKIRNTKFIRFVLKIFDYLGIEVKSKDQIKEIICKAIK